MSDAIVIVDVQNDFRAIMSDSFIESIKKLVTYAYLLKIPVVWIKAHYFQVTPPKLSEEDRLKGTHTGDPMCIEGTPGAEIIDEFSPYLKHPNARVLVKKWYSSFKETSLHSFLTERSINRIALCGLTASTCVLATQKDSIELNYTSTVIEDCIAAFSPKRLAKGLSELKNVIRLSEYTNGFEIFCEGDTFLLNNIFPSTVYSESVFDELAAADGWKSSTIRGGTLSRLVNIQAKRPEDEEGGFVPLYRNPGDAYIEAEPLSPIVGRMMDHLNSRLNLDGFELNHVFMKYYRVAAEGIGRHSDKTLDLLPHSYIANVSLGSTRSMTFRHKVTGDKQQATLRSNSCLLIGMKTNRVWLHEVKGVTNAAVSDTLTHDGARMSFTFRSVGTYYCKDRHQFRGLGAPVEGNIECMDRERMIAAFSAENAQADFEREPYYGQGFWALHT